MPDLVIARRASATAKAKQRLEGSPRLPAPVGPEDELVEIDLELPAAVGLWVLTSASLHAKTFAVDGARAFVGSFNFDPRSALLNTEMGVVIESPALARGLAEWFDTRVPLLAYEVKRTNSGEKRHDTEPGAGFFLRSWVGFLSLLPIEREL